MSNKVFFLGTLLLPVLVGYLGYFLPEPLDGVFFLWQFAATPYFITAGVLAILIFFLQVLSQSSQ